MSQKSQHIDDNFCDFPQESKIFFSDFPFVLLLNMHHIVIMLFIFHWDKPFNGLHGTIKTRIFRM